MEYVMAKIVPNPEHSRPDTVHYELPCGEVLAIQPDQFGRGLEIRGMGRKHTGSITVAPVVSNMILVNAQ
jgi:hypothetical protein